MGTGGRLGQGCLKRGFHVVHMSEYHVNHIEEWEGIFLLFFRIY